jgi:hypothetical protein
MSVKSTIDRRSIVQRQRMLHFSDLLPIPMARLWRLLRVSLMLSAAGLFIGTTTVHVAHALDRPASPAPVADELMHDIIQTPQVSSLPQTKVVWMEVTAYCPCTKCCGPRILPFGSKVIVPGYTQTPVEVIDRGSAIRGNHLDVFFSTHEQAVKWGRQWIPVTVLD